MATTSDSQTLRGKASMTFASLASQLKPLSNDAAKRVSMGVQFAKEKLGSTTDVTELPPKYRELEEKVDKIRVMHESLLKLTINFQKPHYDYAPHISETAKDVAASVRDGWSSFMAGGGMDQNGRTSVPHPSTKEEIPPSLSHAISKVAKTAATGMNPQEPFTVTLEKIADAYETIGHTRVKMDTEITQSVHAPLTTTLNQLIAHATKARRHVSLVRLNYDSARAKLKTAKPQQEDAARAEMEATEDAFVAAVDDAMSKMALVVDSTEPIKNWAKLVEAQLAYYKQAHEVLAGLVPEIEELMVTNEALKAPSV
ncbi:hypothetical protein CcCBS67573_g04164 [Chytriomyces confervae]|uniref:BAR domain-containing protein n=1 Tax=Chytriomyces confervae TaxID=246404 RepID=A0A507FEC3_9FUNG|nr:hypothetical protein CcCBS67573_g04164 [Chytriomyces confervae]